MSLAERISVVLLLRLSLEQAAAYALQEEDRLLRPSAQNHLI